MDKAKQLSEELLKKIGVDGKVNVAEKDGTIHIDIETEDSGLLIGYHAETLQALQLIIGMMVNRGSKEWQQIIADVGEYRKQRQETLKRMAKRAAQQVRDTGEDQELPSMSSFERRLIHIFITEEKGVVSESRGKGHYRRVVVKAE